MASPTMFCSACGRAIPWTKEVAGTQVTCACGNVVPMPPRPSGMMAPGEASAPTPSLRGPDAGTGGDRIVSTPVPTKKPLSPIKSGLFMCLLGGILIVMAFSEYHELGEMETHGGTKRVHVLVSMLYKMFGKLGVGIGLGVLGAGILVGGIAVIAKSARNRRG